MAFNPLHRSVDMTSTVSQVAVVAAPISSSSEYAIPSSNAAPQTTLSVAPSQPSAPPPTTIVPSSTSTSAASTPTASEVPLPSGPAFGVTDFAFVPLSQDSGSHWWGPMLGGFLRPMSNSAITMNRSVSSYVPYDNATVVNSTQGVSKPDAYLVNSIVDLEFAYPFSIGLGPSDTSNTGSLVLGNAYDSAKVQNQAAWSRLPATASNGTISLGNIDVTSGGNTLSINTHIDFNAEVVRMPSGLHCAEDLQIILNVVQYNTTNPLNLTIDKSFLTAGISCLESTQAQSTSRNRRQANSETLSLGKPFFQAAYAMFFDANTTYITPAVHNSDTLAISPETATDSKSSRIIAFDADIPAWSPGNASENTNGQAAAPTSTSLSSASHSSGSNIGAIVGGVVGGIVGGLLLLALGIFCIRRHYRRQPSQTSLRNSPSRGCADYEMDQKSPLTSSTAILIRPHSSHDGYDSDQNRSVPRQQNVSSSRPAEPSNRFLSRSYSPIASQAPEEGIHGTPEGMERSTRLSGEKRRGGVGHTSNKPSLSQLIIPQRDGASISQTQSHQQNHQSSERVATTGRVADTDTTYQPRHHVQAQSRFANNQRPSSNASRTQIQQLQQSDSKRLSQAPTLNQARNITMSSRSSIRSIDMDDYEARRPSDEVMRDAAALRRDSLDEIEARRGIAGSRFSERC